MQTIFARHQNCNIDLNIFGKHSNSLSLFASITRMHSSRMRTVRGRVGVCPDGGVCPGGCLPKGGYLPRVGVFPCGGLPRGVCPGGSVRQPSVNRMTDRQV